MDSQTRLLTTLLAPARPTAIVDVGANPIDGDPPYKAMLAAGLCRIVGFEPQAGALARLNQSKGPHELYLPYALADGTERTLHVCELEGMTSLLVPDPSHLALFNLFPIWGNVKERLPVATRKLDDISEILAAHRVNRFLQSRWVARLKPPTSPSILDNLGSCIVEALLAIMFNNKNDAVLAGLFVVACIT